MSSQARFLSRRKVLLAASLCGAAGLAGSLVRAGAVAGDSCAVMRGAHWRPTSWGQRAKASADEVPALVRRFPQLSPMEPGAGVKIQNSLARVSPAVLQGLVAQGLPGTAAFGQRDVAGRHLIPWVPLFERNRTLAQASPTLTRLVGCRTLAVRDEGSDTHPLFGNKARKYEYLLPNLAWAKTERMLTVGALQSNHALHLAVANRLGAVDENGHALRAKLALALYPQAASAESACIRLALLRELGADVHLLDGNVGTARSFVAGYAEERVNSRFAFIRPGGSSELSVLGHIDAMLELAEDMHAGWTAIAKPPDVLFVAVGSGASVLGLVLGIQILGWPTRVVAVASQDKGWLPRAVASGHPELPFAMGNLVRLGTGTLEWLARIGFPHDFPTLESLFASHLSVDAQAWAPEYGVMSEKTKALCSAAAAEGLTLDATFTSKAFASMVERGRQGTLKDCSVLFWNTFNRFDYASLLGTTNVAEARRDGPG